ELEGFDEVMEMLLATLPPTSGSPRGRRAVARGTGPRSSGPRPPPRCAPRPPRVLRRVALARGARRAPAPPSRGRLTLCYGRSREAGMSEQAPEDYGEVLGRFFSLCTLEQLSGRSVEPWLEGLPPEQRLAVLSFVDQRLDILRVQQWLAGLDRDRQALAL